MARYFSLLQIVHTAAGAQTASSSMGAGDLSPGVMCPGRKVDHAPVSSAEVENEGRGAVYLLSLYAAHSGTRSGNSLYFSIAVSSLPEKDVGEITQSAKTNTAL